MSVRIDHIGLCVYVNSIFVDCEIFEIYQFMVLGCEMFNQLVVGRVRSKLQMEDFANSSRGYLAILHRRLE